MNPYVFARNNAIITLTLHLNRYQPLVGNEQGLVAYWTLNDWTLDKSKRPEPETFTQERSQKAMNTKANPKYKILFQRH